MASRGPRPSNERLLHATNLIGEALAIAEIHPAASVPVTRGAATLIPQLWPAPRKALAQRWMAIAFSWRVPRGQRMQSLSAFFDEAARQDTLFAHTLALSLPDAAARSAAFIRLSERTQSRNWTQSNDFARLAQRAAHKEMNPLERSQALTTVALRTATLNPATRRPAVMDAWNTVKQLKDTRERDYLLTDVVGAAANFDLGLARRISRGIQQPGLRNLATARINLSEISQTTLMVSNADRIAAVAKAAAPYDMRAIPILLQLPPQPDVFRALSSALPEIKPTAQPGISANLLERIWLYASASPPSVHRDQLQSRLARLMVLHNLWQGRDWGKQLPWKGGRIQVGAFLRSVIEARRSALKIRPIQDLARRNVNRALLDARKLPPAARAEALLLIAGQLIG